MRSHFRKKINSQLMNPTKMCPPLRRISILFAIFSIGKILFAFDVPEMDAQKFPIEVYGDYLEWRNKANQVVTKGNAFIAYKDMQLKADTIQSNTKTEDLFAQGKVDFWKGFDQTTGDFLSYNMKTGKGWMRDASIRRNRNYFRAKDVYVSPSYSLAHDVLQTTCDNVDHPHYRISAKKIEAIAGKTMTMEDLALRWKGKNLYRKALDVSKQKESKESFFKTRQGLSQIDGFYLKFSTDLELSQTSKGIFTYDYFQKRGYGAGFSGNYTGGDNNNGSISIYNLQEVLRDHSNLQLNLSHNYRFKNGDSLSTNISYTGDKVPQYPENQDLNVQMNMTTRFKFVNLNITANKFFDIDGDSYTQDEGYQLLNRIPEVNFTLPGYTLPIIPISTNFSGMFGRYEEGNLKEKKNTEKKNIRSTFSYPSTVIGKRFDLTPSYNFEKSWYSEGVERETGTTMIRGNQKFSNITNLELNYNLTVQKGGTPFKFDTTTPTDFFSARLRVAENTWTLNPINFNYNRVMGRLEQVYWDFSRRSRTDAYRNWEFFVRRDYNPAPVPFGKMSMTQLTPGNLNIRYRLASDLWSFDTSFTYPHEYRRITDTSINYRAVIRPLWEVGVNGHYSHLNKQFSPFSLNITRDLHCWEMKAEYNLERKEFWMEFYLKAYPGDAGRFRYGADTNRLEAKFAQFDQMTQGYDTFRR